MEVAIERRAREGVIGELEAEVDVELGEGTLGLFVEQRDCVVCPRRGPGVTGFAAIGAPLRQQPQIALALIGGDPAVERALRDGPLLRRKPPGAAGFYPGPLHGGTGTAA